MRHLAYRFHVEGEYCEHLEGLPDPADEEWVLFDLRDLHPNQKDHITIWVPNFTTHCDEALQEAIDRAVVVVEWMKDGKGWDGFDASLWLNRGNNKPERVFRWELV